MSKPDSKYPFAFGFLESAVHRALRELKDERSRRSNDASMILIGALRDLVFNHGIELHWPDDVKDQDDV